MEHIERMEKELKDLREKCEKAVEFLSKEQVNPKFLDEKQYELLENQLSLMGDYAEILEERIKYDKKLVDERGKA